MHSFSWVDDEVAEVDRCNGTVLTPALGIDIYDWTLCPVCGHELKLRQVNEIVERIAATGSVTERLRAPSKRLRPI